MNINYLKPLGLTLLCYLSLSVNAQGGPSQENYNITISTENGEVRIEGAVGGTASGASNKYAGDVSVVEAIQLCRQFLKRINATMPQSVPEVQVNEVKGKREDAIDIRFRNEFSFTVDTKCHWLLKFSNDQLVHLRANQQREGKLNDRKPQVTNRLNASPYLIKAQQAIGIEPSYKLALLLGTSDPVVKVSPSEPYSKKNHQEFVGQLETDAFYVQLPYGYPVITGANYRVALDNYNGQIRSFYFYTGSPYRIESHQVKLSEKQAMAIAKTIMKKTGHKLTP